MELGRVLKVPAKLHLLDQDTQVNQLIKSKGMDLPLQRNAAWIAGSFCLLASYLWHALWAVLSCGRKRKIPAPGSTQVVDIFLIIKTYSTSFSVLIISVLIKQVSILISSIDIV